MKRFFTLMMMTVALIATSCAQSKSNDKQNDAVVVMNKQMCLDKVFDYTSGATEWKYIGDKPCIIDFYATWCAPCRMISPILKEIAEQYKDSIYVFKVDVDKQKKLAGALGIQSMPTIFFIPKDDKPQVIVGAADKATFHRAVKEVLLKEGK